MEYDLKKIFFSIILILIAGNEVYHIKDNQGFVKQNLRLFGEKLSLKCLNNLRKYSKYFILLENSLFILTAFFIIFDVGFHKTTGTLAVLIELILVHNPVFYGENGCGIIASQYLALLGGIILF